MLQPEELSQWEKILRQLRGVAHAGRVQTKKPVPTKPLMSGIISQKSVHV